MFNVKEKIFLENDDNLLCFPTINNINRQQQTSFNGSNTNTFFNELLSNTNANNSISTNNSRQLPLKCLTFPQQHMRNDENTYHNNHPHIGNVHVFTIISLILIFFLAR